MTIENGEKKKRRSPMKNSVKKLKKIFKNNFFLKFFFQKMEVQRKSDRKWGEIGTIMNSKNQATPIFQNRAATCKICARGRKNSNFFRIHNKKRREIQKFKKNVAHFAHPDSTLHPIHCFRPRPSPPSYASCDDFETKFSPVFRSNEGSPRFLVVVFVSNICDNGTLFPIPKFDSLSMSVGFALIHLPWRRPSSSMETLAVRVSASRIGSRQSLLTWLGVGCRRRDL